MLNKDIVFKFEEECLLDFQTLKERLVFAPVIMAPN